MNPTDRLIVALDVPNDEAIAIVSQLRLSLKVKNFKLSASNLMGSHRDLLLAVILRSDNDALKSNLMLDLKVWDTPDSVRRIVGAALATGARWVTVKAEAEVVAAALDAAREYPGAMILPVGNLTSNPTAANSARPDRTGGAIVPACDLRSFRRLFPHALLISPGIRLLSTDDSHDHHVLAHVSPADAVRLGADHVIVGRPITGAIDPVAVARTYLENLENA